METAEELQKKLEEQRQKELVDCQNVINEALRRYDCSLVPVITLIGGNTPQAEVKIILNK